MLMRHPEIFARRRERLRTLMGHGVLVVFAAPVFIRNNDVQHEYRQHSDFFYLTGLDEPGCVLVLSAGEKGSCTLFVRLRNKEREIWDGPRTGVEGAKGEYGADEAFDIVELSQQLPKQLLGHTQLFYSFGEFAEHDTQLIAALSRSRLLARRTGLYPHTIIESDQVVHEMRWLKDDHEVGLMLKANSVTLEAHHQAMRLAAPGRHEYELEALIRHTFRMAGCERSAYAPIVGSGANTTILHYIKNDQQLKDGDLVLIDAGCEFEYYAADVTRTFPVGGRFTEPQRALYQVVLDAQYAAIDVTKPGSTLLEQHEAALKVLTQGLIDLQLIEGSLETALSEERYKPFYMHRTGHYLGMDVHDVGAGYVEGRPRPFEPGVVVTIEPGLYVAADNESVPPEYRGLGIRIEDDVLVTADGYRNLSDGIVKTVDDVERMCAG
ncbi:MAG: hypothetical protein RJA70_2688 [Pseudomonadota bacterium]|jgi:Xaa-Pro aminopeptidase